MINKPKIIWEGEPKEELLPIIYDELHKFEDSRNLVFTTIFLEDDFDGPSICLSGDPKTGDVTASYTKKTEWSNF